MTTGDVDALVAVKSRDLSHAYAYLQIAETLRAAGTPRRGARMGRAWREGFPRTDRFEIA